MILGHHFVHVYFIISRLKLSSSLQDDIFVGFWKLSNAVEGLVKFQHFAEYVFSRYCFVLVANVPTDYLDRSEYVLRVDKI